VTTDNPKVMSTVGAILITVGSIPAIPAVAAGAGGVVLASHAVQTIGAIAVGVGNLLRSQGGKTPDQEKTASEAVATPAASKKV
jgi:flagellar biosynthesis component FlhA